LDLTILKFVNVTLANPAFDIFFKYIGDLNLWRWPLALALALLLWKGGPRGRWFALAAVMAVAIVDPSIHYILKPLFGRLRPCKEAALVWLRLIDGCGGKYSLPSSHAANLMAIAVVSGSFYKKSRYFLYPLAILVAISRVYLGVHYPTDILAGAAYGAAIGILVLIPIKPLARKKSSGYLAAQT
jgi:undecaprenyl-diphosphatase